MEDQQITPASSPLDNFFNIAFDPAVRAQVRQATLWAKICTLCAFVGYAIALVVAFFGQQQLETEYSMSSEGLQVANTVRTVTIGTVLVSTAFGVFINYFLYRFAVSTAKGMNSMDSVKTNEGFNSLRRYFKIYGILLIIALSLCGLGLLFALIGAAMR